MTPCLRRSDMWRSTSLRLADRVQLQRPSETAPDHVATSRRDHLKACAWSPAEKRHRILALGRFISRRAIPSSSWEGPVPPSAQLRPQVQQDPLLVFTRARQQAKLLHEATQPRTKRRGWGNANRKMCVKE